MTNYQLRLNCERCGRFTEYASKTGDPDSVVRCDECGKKHSTDSVYMADLHRTYQRDESGALVEDI